MRTHLETTPLAYIFLLVLSIWAISPAVAATGDREIAKQAWPMIAQGALLIDVRSKEEFDEGHIEGAANIPHDDINALQALIGDEKTRPVVLYCHSGNRSSKAQKQLQEKGYLNIFDATGYAAMKATRP